MPDWSEHLRPRLAPLELEGSRELEIIEELSQHLDERYEELRADGATDAEARQLAVEELREPEALAQHMRALRRVRAAPPTASGEPTRYRLVGLWQDLRYAARMLRKQPGFTMAAVATLALGIGATTAIFSLINAAWLRALPFPDAPQLAVIWADNPGRNLGVPVVPPANADVAQWRAHTGSFARIAAFSASTADLAGSGDPERVGAARVTAGFFETLGVTPLVGRTLAPDEEGPGRSPVALIGHALWQRRFGGDPALVGKAISINGEAHTVIGILPRDFDFPRAAEWPAFFPFAARTEVWLPLAFRAQDDGSGWSNWQSRDERSLIVIGRLKPDTGLDQAQAEMGAFAARAASDHPDTHKGWRLTVVPLREQMAGHAYASLLVLFSAVGLLLIIACVNVANLLVARGVTRQQEVAVRAALGAGRGRLIRQLFTECLLLGALASGLALLVAEGCLKTFLILNPTTHSRLDEASLDPVVLGFAGFAALVTIGLFGLVPALQASRSDLRTPLLDGGRGSDGAVRGRVRTWLVAVEVALAFMLLTTAGLMVRSFLRVQAVEPGFRADSVLAFDVGLPAPQVQQLIARLQALPAVRAAGAISYLPLGGGENAGQFAVEGNPPVTPGNEPSAERRWVTPGYFAAMGIPIQQGRVFTPDDTDDHPRVVVINEVMARQFFGSRNPLGRRLSAGGAWRTVVGVVADVKSASLEREVGPQLYVPHAQWPWAGMTVVLHTNGDPLALVSAARGELKAIDPLLPAVNMRTMEQVVSKAASSRRFNMALLAFFAGTALLLTQIGIYGVVAFLVGRRSREISVRVALGATRDDILRLVLQEGMKPVALGCAAGLLGSLVASHLVASQLYGVFSSDPVTLASTIALLAATALVACWLPARRATNVHPMASLRN